MRVLTFIVFFFKRVTRENVGRSFCVVPTPELYGLHKCWVGLGSHTAVTLGRQYFAVQKHSRVPYRYLRRTFKGRGPPAPPAACLAERHSRHMHLAHQPNRILLSIEGGKTGRGLPGVQSCAEKRELICKTWERRQFSWIASVQLLAHDAKMGDPLPRKTENFQILSFRQCGNCMSIVVCTRNP